MHISSISKLYNQPADSYRGLIQKAMDDKDLVVRVYEPLRRAAVAETREPGAGAEVLRNLLPRLDSMKRSDALKLHNVEAFARYRESFRDRWPVFVEDHMDSRHLAPVSLGGLPFTGRFHFSAETADGLLEHVYVSASKTDQDMVTAMRELLAIIACDRHGCERRQAVLLDLNKGALYHPSKNYVQTRRKLENVLQIGSLIEKEFGRK